MPSYTKVIDNKLAGVIVCRTDRIAGQMGPGETYIEGSYPKTLYAESLDAKGAPVALSASALREKSLSVDQRLARDYPEPSPDDKIEKLIETLKAQNIDLTAYDSWLVSMTTKS